ncbi:carboxylesterase/lipase family protein [Henriciella litoralis]|uniref:carboxylesterase/lipase family protein n=1 Tax=Henriciella litoralis TaxID=568102 RepID=UPI00111C12FF|nr:carboxylesterase/lipase family protein [Henriciella litoralis]
MFYKSLTRKILASSALVCLAITAPVAMAQQAGESEQAAEVAIERPVAQTAYGPVRGAVEEGVNVFLGIPYGADTRTTRFKKADKPEAWTEVREATSYPDSTLQVATGTALFASWQPDPVPAHSENALGLNVWTPGLDDHKRPVMVWLHGGGFENGNGSSTAYEGVNLANRGDVVVVTINHRLNAMGYLYLAELEGGEAYPDSGNIGNLDMIMALEWVRDNIEEFGGNPENVTIFGESGGGRKVSTLLAMPEAEGLIDRAIVQSGSHMRIRTAEQATKDSIEYLDRLGLKPDELDKLDEIEPEAFEAALKDGRLFFGPVLDGVHMTAHPWDPAAPASAMDVPMLIGNNDDEASIFLFADKRVWTVDFDGIPALASAYGRGGQATPELVAGYREIFPDQTPTELLFTIVSDFRYGHNAVLQALRKSEQGGAPVWLYLFDWQTPVAGGRLKTPHALEIPFAFDTLENSESMVGDPAAAQPVADQMSEAWISFARFGDPNARGLPHWPAYNAETSPVMRINTESKVETGYFARERAILEAE